MNEICLVNIYFNIRLDKCKFLVWMYIKYFYLKKKIMKCLIRDFYNVRFLFILRIFKCIVSIDNVFKILVILNLVYIVL